MLAALLISRVSVILSQNNGGPAIYDNDKWGVLEDIQQAYPKPISDSWMNPSTEIFISISNFLDSDRCALSIRNYLSKAKYPNRLKFGELILSRHTSP
jgi:hypothetical protein